MIEKNVELACELMKYRSVAGDRKEIEGIVDFAERYFSGKGLFVKKHEINGKLSLVVTLDDTKSPRIFLCGHLDVVNAPEEDFVPKIEDGKIFGRGAADMKGAVAAMILAVDHFATREDRPSLGLILTTDEEEGGFDGTGKLLEEYSCQVAIVPDGGNDVSRIVNREKGVLQIKVTAQGRSSHSSRPWEGDNAIDKLLAGYYRARKLFPESDPEGKWHPTLNLGVIKGGEKANKVPDFAEALFDIRLTEKEDISGMFRKVVEAFEGCKVEIYATGDIFHVSAEDACLEKYARVLQRATARKVLFAREHGSSDARFFAGKKIPVIMNQPNCGNLHAPGEWIDIESMEIFYKVLLDYILEEGFEGR